MYRRLLKTRLTVLLLWAILPFDLTAQERPSILIDDIGEEFDRLKCFCQPGVINKSRSQGVAITYNFVGSGQLSSVANGVTQLPDYDKFRNLQIKLAYPLIRKESTKVILNAAYQEEQFEFSEIDRDYRGLISTFNQRDLRRTRFGVAWVQSLNESNYIALRFQASFNGAYDGIVNFSKRYAVYSGLGTFAIKKSELEEFGIGLAYSNNFRTRKTQVLPFLFWNKSFTPHWGIETTIPTSVFIRYNLSPTTIILTGVNYNSESYSVDMADGGVAEILSSNHSEILFTTRVQQQIIPWLWIEGQVGLQKSFRAHIENQVTEQRLLSIDPSNSAYFKIGIFISPPDSITEKEHLAKF